MRNFRTSNFLELFFGIFLVFSTANLQVDCHYGGDNSIPDFTWTITNLKDKLKEPYSTLQSPVFPLLYYDFGAKAKLARQSDNLIYISLALKDTSNSGRDLNLKLIPTISFDYKIKGSKNVILKHDAFLYGSVLQYDAFKYHKFLIQANEMVSDEISIEIRVESPKETKFALYDDGIFPGTENFFREEREREEEGLVEYQQLPYFYTSPRGYRLFAFTYLNGLGKYEGKGLTVQINFLTGPYDADDHDTSIPHTTTVTLVHPTDPTKRIVKSVDQDPNENRRDIIDVATHEELEELLDKRALHYEIKVVIHKI